MEINQVNLTRRNQKQTNLWILAMVRHNSSLLYHKHQLPGTHWKDSVTSQTFAFYGP